MIDVQATDGAGSDKVQDQGIVASWGLSPAILCIGGLLLLVTILAIVNICLLLRLLHLSSGRNVEAVLVRDALLMIRRLGSFGQLTFGQVSLICV